MPRHMPTLKLVLVCLLTAVGCSYTPPKPASQRPEEYPFRVFSAGVTVAVNPFISEQRLKETLSSGEDYLNNNVLPIQILIRNDGQDEQLFRVAAVRLVWSDGILRTPLTNTETFERIKDSVWGGGTIGALALGGVGAVVVAGAVSNRNDTRMKDVETVALKDANISTGSSRTGFAFFPLQKEDASLKGTKLRVVLQNPTSLTETAFEIALEGDFAKARTTQPVKP